MLLWLPSRAVLWLLLDGRLVVAVELGRELVPAVGRLAVPAVGRLLLPVCGRALLVPLPLVRPELLPAATRPVDALLEAVGRVPLIEPEVVLPETEAPLCGPTLLLPVGRLIEPAVPVLP